MQFDLSEEQEALSEFLRDLLESKSDSAGLRKTIDSDAPYDEELWGVLCEQIGAASLAIPEEYGGAGFTTRETHIVLEELGRALTPSPFLGSIAIAAQAILNSGNEEASERLLPEIASGAKIATLAWADPNGSWNPSGVQLQATGDGDATLSGEVSYVFDGTYADIVLAIAQGPSGPGLYEVSDLSGLNRRSTPTLDQTLNLATLTFEGVPAKLLSADPQALLRIRDHALTAITATQVGTANMALDLTVEYSKQRTQFGRQIGSYQALKHRMADMYVLLETARTTSYAAAWAEANLAPEWSELAVLAKATCSETLSQIAGETIQLHGGIAITWEHDAHLIFKRAHATAQLFGTPSDMRKETAAVLGLNS